MRSKAKLKIERDEWIKRAEYHAERAKRQEGLTDAWREAAETLKKRLDSSLVPNQ